MSQSAGAISLQQAFSELRQNQFDPGPSTAPASIHSTHPSLQPSASPVPSQASTVSSTADITPGLVPSNLSKAQEQVMDASLPPHSSSPFTVAAVSLSPPSSSSPPPTGVNQSILQPQPGTQTVSHVQGQAQIQPQAFTQPQSQSVSAVTATSVPSTLPPASISNIAPTMLTSPPPAQTVPLVSSPPSSTLTAIEVSSIHQAVSSASSSTPPLSSPAIPGPQITPSAASHTTPPSSSPAGLQPVTTNVSSVQPALVHSQPQTAALPGQTHTHCGECDSRWESVDMFLFIRATKYLEYHTTK